MKMDPLSFHRLFVDLQINEVHIIEYGQKASVQWGLGKMHSLRKADPDCILNFDAATVFSPNELHLFLPQNELPPNENFVTLVLPHLHTSFRSKRRQQ